jgi:4-diphosphocytidyl-2-C-methyl-D-erythritol kinase
MTIRILAPAKLNLFLHITGKRSDGFHLLESLVAFAEFGDVLTVKPADMLTLDIGGPFAGPLEYDKNNTILKAAQLLKSFCQYHEGAHITLEKRIPIGAGLGGGSSDAATALLALKKLWRLNIDKEGLQKIALQTGSDVPVCLTQQTAWMRGIGEDITPVAMPAEIGLLLVNPGVPLLTSSVFRKFSGTFSQTGDIPKSIDSFDALIQLIQSKHNALEAPAIALVPVISDVLKAIGATQECKLARMSGSGATCFGLYQNPILAKQAASEIKRQHPDWFCQATRITALSSEQDSVAESR